MGKRLVIAIILFPVTAPMWVGWRFMEWFHFKVSQRLLTHFRGYARWIDTFWRTFK